MAQTNYTPISLYYSTTASAVPTAANLVPGELAINTNDGKLYYEDSSGVVRVLATKSTGTIGGSTTQVQYNSSGSLAGSANFVFDGTNVGIGTSSPAVLLDVNGIGYFRNLLYVSGSYGISSDSASPILFKINNVEKMTLTSAGNVGIGTSSPTGSLEIATSSATSIVANSSNATGGWIEYKRSGTTYAYIGNAGALTGSNTDDLAIQAIAGKSLRFQTNGNNTRMVIDTSGRLLINSPSFTEGMVSIKCSSSSSGISIGVLTNGDNAVNFYNSSNTYVASIVVNSGTIVYGTVSDYRFKENILPMTNALEKVSLLKPCTYTWKNNGDVGQGFIAHELQEVIPDAVSGKKDAMETYIDENGDEQTRIKPQGVDTSFVVATLTAAIQEQQALIESLTTRLTALENK